MKLDTQLFNRVLEQVRTKGPDEDMRVEAGEGAFDPNNTVYMNFVDMATAYVVLNPRAAIASAFQVGMEVAFQYQKVSQEVKSLNKMLDN